MPQAVLINSIYGLTLIRSLTCHYQERPHHHQPRYHKTIIPISILMVIRANHRLVYQLLLKAHHNHNHKTKILILINKVSRSQQQPLQTSPQVPSTVQSQQPTQSQSSTIPSVTNPSQYQLQQPQQQNQSSSSLTSAAQYPYQSQQQPQSSQSFATGQPSVSTLIIVTHVNNTGSRIDANAADNFTQIVENTFTNPDGYANVYHYMKGSQIGVTLSLQPGGFSVYELNKNLKSSNPPLNQSTYNIAYSGDCMTAKSNTGSNTYGYGTINLGETKTCTVTLSLHK